MGCPDEFALEIRAALELDQEERTYLSTLNLAASWRAQRTHASQTAWGWLALFGVISVFAAWSLVIHPFTDMFDAADVVGFGAFALTTLVGLLFEAGQSLTDVAMNPALGLIQPMLLVLALAILFWPRITSVPHYLQGV